MEVYSNKKSNIQNIIVKNISENVLIYNLNLIFITDFSFKLVLNMNVNENNTFDEHNIDNFISNNINIKIINKYDENEYIFFNKNIEPNDCHEFQIDCSFKLIKELDYVDNVNDFVPKIIHQSYKKKVKTNMFKAILSWKLTNINYEYKYWDDDECYNLIKNNFNEDVLIAYNMLYAGAYKSDIFRLCVLYLYGGIWTDISSECLCPLDHVINNNYDLTIVKDMPSQVTNGNIYQAFIIAKPKNYIIKYILDFTVNRVINNEAFNIEYPFVVNECIAVTGPTIFATALNILLKRKFNEIFYDNEIKTNFGNIKLLEHFPQKILYNNIKIINTKYENWISDRSDKHYSTLFFNKLDYKKKINNIINCSNDNAINIFQIWIQSNYVSKNMYNAIQTIINNNNNINYYLFTDNEIQKILTEQTDFPLLLNAYNSVKPYAFKSDIARLYLLYYYGGIYIDIDMICTSSLINLYEDNDLVLVRDIDNNNMVNGFMCCKKNNEFIKFLIETIIVNVTNKINITLKNQLFLTGPGILGECFAKFYGIERPFSTGTLIFNKKIKIIDYKFNLPLPTGCWKQSSKNYFVKNGNILEAECKNIKGNYIKNIINFSIDDDIMNVDGILNGHHHFKYECVDGSGLIFSKEDNITYLISKYPEYNNERLLLGGNDFAKLVKQNEIYNF